MFLQSRANQRHCPGDTNRSMELDASSGAQQFRGYTFRSITVLLEIPFQEVLTTAAFLQLILCAGDDKSCGVTRTRTIYCCHFIAIISVVAFKHVHLEPFGPSVVAILMKQLVYAGVFMKSLILRVVWHWQ
jgi:hypothetical protein